MSTAVTYTAVLAVKRSTAEHLAQLLRDHRIAARTRKGWCALGCFRQAVLILRWFGDGARLSQLACDSGLSTSTAYRYLHEGNVQVIATPDGWPIWISPVRPGREHDTPASATTA